MASLIELVRLIALLVGLGALSWAGFAVIATSNEFGSHHPEQLGPVYTSLGLFAGAAAVYVLLGRIGRGRR